MSRNFKLTYDQMRESNPTKEELPENRLNEVEVYYPEESNARNICLVWENGKRIFLNYSYLISGEYLPDDGAITLAFTSQVFILKGVNLEALFYDIMQQRVRQIVCTDSRYNTIGEDQKFVVNQVMVAKTSDALPVNNP